MGEQKRKHVAATIAKARLLGMVELHGSYGAAIWIETESFLGDRSRSIKGMRPFDTLYQAAIYHLTAQGLSYEEIVKAAGGAGGGSRHGFPKRRRKRARAKSKPKSARVAQR